MLVLARANAHRDPRHRLPQSLAAMKKKTFRLVWSAAAAFQKNDASQLSLKFSPTPEHSGELLKNFRTLAA